MDPWLRHGGSAVRSKAISKRRQRRSISGSLTSRSRGIAALNVGRVPGFMARSQAPWVRDSGARTAVGSCDGRVCEVVAAEPGRLFAFRTVPERFDPSRADSTTWSYSLSPQGTGTRVTHSYEITKPPIGVFKLVYGRLLPHHRDMRPRMTETLDALRVELDGSGSPADGREA